MKIALIIVTILLVFSFIIRQGLLHLSKTNPLELISNYNTYNTIANINAVIFIFSIITEIILLINIIL
jgi:hypothetical protein